MIHQAHEKGIFQDLNLKGELNNTRSLQFADDTIVVSKANFKDISTIKLILYIFEQISGLGINFEKSSFYYFGKLESRGKHLADALNCQLGKLPFTYLGLPLANGKLTKKEWDPLIRNFQKKLSAWKGRSMSIGGRLTLVNSVLSSLPLYFISFFKLPTWLLRSINSLRARFLWGTTDNYKSTKHLVSWDKVCVNKKEGGLGVIELSSFNDCLMAKWLWKSIDPKSTFYNFAKSIYAPNGSILNLEPSQNKSLLMNSILRLKHLVVPHLTWKLGNGKNIRFWEDRWIGNTSLRYIFPKVYDKALDKRCLVDTQGRWSGNRWEWQLLLRERRSILTEVRVLMDILNGTVCNTESDIPS